MADLLKLRTLFRPTPPRTSGPAPFAPTSTQPRAPAKPPASIVARSLDLFEASPSKPKGVNLGGGNNVRPSFPKYPPTLDILRYQRVQQQAPRPEDFTDPREYNLAKEAHERRLAPLVPAAAEDFLRYIQQEAQETPTGNKIIDAAREAGVEVVVLPDAEYSQRYPGSIGVHDDGKVYVPVSSIDDPSDTNDVDILVHEYVHALIGDGLGPDVPQSTREAEAREAFEALGLPPEAGAEIARQTDGWENPVAIEHVVTAYVTRRMAREREGLPPESPQEEAAAIERISDRELAIGLRANREGDNPISDAELVEQWENTPTGQRYPPEGDTVEEKAAWIEEQMDTLALETYVDPPPPGNKTQD
ncbi:hypothetical protein HPC49_01375 [Pyxidicoccus fallax]|uniref:Uncharacterized protein n=1 Tax=Pyxidicoccus fallax TaxID=394095 RepID=A0A848LEF8_9BACT|nr:hypothetical protein [Pyxidicoccus fallax]NMO15205.1 hypothetical protein [Pyxidicoccus fallax]NPC76904.1 hypothetical protein [Pyxidicoccus fallax]